MGFMWPCRRRLDRKGFWTNLSLLRGSSGCRECINDEDQSSWNNYIYDLQSQWRVTHSAGAICSFDASLDAPSGLPRYSLVLAHPRSLLFVLLYCSCLLLLSHRLNFSLLSDCRVRANSNMSVHAAWNGCWLNRSMYGLIDSPLCDILWYSIKAPVWASCVPKSKNFDRIWYSRLQQLRLFHSRWFPDQWTVWAWNFSNRD